jgi:N-acetylneuraminic acid mutarotase
MYIVGGYAEENPGDGGSTTTSVLKFDIEHGSWSVVAPMPEERGKFAACVHESDIYLFGGHNTWCRPESVLKYSTEADEWSILAHMSESESGHSAVELGGLMYIVGAGNHAASCLRYDPASGLWSTLASLNASCYNGTSFALNGYIYAVGGESTELESKVQRYDVISDTWTEVADMLEGRYLSCAVTIKSAEITEERELFDSLIAKTAMQDP